MANRTLRRTREVAGPGVGAVAIIARPPPTVPIDFLIMQRRQQEDTLRSRAQAAEELRVFDIKCKWEQTTDGKIKATSIKRRVDELLQERKFRLRERQLKLRAQLEEEEKRYIEEIAMLVETPLEREAKMRDRLRQLKDARETERAEIAGEKLEKHFLSNCEQLRTLRSKQETHIINTHRSEQLRVKQTLQEREKETEKLYAELWDQDRQAKDKRAADEEALRRARNMEQSAVLSKQMAAIEENRLWQARLREEEEKARLEEASALADAERRDQQIFAENRRKQINQMARFNRALQREQQKRMEEEQALDQRVVLAALQAHEQEQSEHLQKKDKWANEARSYLKYLADQRAAQAQLQVELDRLLDGEAEKMWKRRTDQWDAERDARAALMAEVLETRKLQVQAKLDALRWEQDQAADEAAELNANVEAFHREEAEKSQRAQTLRVQHAKGLELQIVANAEQRAQQRREEIENQDRLIRTQALIDEKTQRALNGLSIRGKSAS